MRFFAYSSSLSTAAAALSEAESAGLTAGAFQVSAKADKSLAERTSLSLFAKERPLWGPRKIGDFVGRGDAVERVSFAACGETSDV